MRTRSDRTHQTPAYAVALFLSSSLLCVLLGAACLSVASSKTNLPDASSLTPVPLVERANCSEIAGTAYRSASERQWYEDNCSRWPLVKAPDSPPPASSNLSPEVAAQCDKMRGKPYESNDQRQFYTSNCLGNNPAGSQPNGNQAAAASQGPDRTNCDEIRGTPYRSDAERAWYLKNCPSQPAPSQTPSISGGQTFQIVPQQPSTSPQIVVVPQQQSVPQTTRPPTESNSQPNRGNGNGNGGGN